MPIALEFWYSLVMAIKSVNSQRMRKQEDILLCYITKQGNFREPLRWLRHNTGAFREHSFFRSGGGPEESL